MRTIVKTLLLATVVAALATVAGAPKTKLSANSGQSECCDNPPPLCPPICSPAPSSSGTH
jgi:hypothetical protein